MRASVTGVLALVLLMASTSMSLLMSPSDQYGYLTLTLLGVIGLASGMLIYAGFRRSRLWWIAAPLGLPCSFIWLLALGH